MGTLLSERGPDPVRHSKKVCKVIYDETGIHGVFALFDGAEPTYAHIEEGEWLNDEPYVTIHRLAGDGRVHGLFQCAAEHCKLLPPMSASIPTPTIRRCSG